MNVVTRDLKLRRRFLMHGHLDLRNHQFVIAHIPPLYERNSAYLRSCAGLALISYIGKQAFALHFCYSNMRRHALNNFLT